MAQGSDASEPRSLVSLQPTEVERSAPEAPKAPSSFPRFLAQASQTLPGDSSQPPDGQLSDSLPDIPKSSQPSGDGEPVYTRRKGSLSWNLKSPWPLATWKSYPHGRVARSSSCPVRVRGSQYRFHWLRRTWYDCWKVRLSRQPTGRLSTFRFGNSPRDAGLRQYAGDRPVAVTRICRWGSNRSDRRKRRRQSNHVAFRFGSQGQSLGPSRLDRDVSVLRDERQLLVRDPARWFTHNRGVGGLRHDCPASPPSAHRPSRKNPRIPSFRGGTILSWSSKDLSADGCR